jgi:hypothetical protein
LAANRANMADSLQPDHLPETKSNFASKVTAPKPREIEDLMVFAEESYSLESWRDDACAQVRLKC